MRFLSERTALRAGPSTGTNLVGALRLACELAERGEGGSIVSLLCDGAERYAGTYRDDAWVASRGWDLAPHLAVLQQAWEDGVWEDGA
jgi:cysteine synthase A